MTKKIITISLSALFVLGVFTTPVARASEVTGTLSAGAAGGGSQAGGSVGGTVGDGGTIAGTVSGGGGGSSSSGGGGGGSGTGVFAANGGGQVLGASTVGNTADPGLPNAGFEPDGKSENSSNALLLASIISASCLLYFASKYQFAD